MYIRYVKDEYSIAAKMKMSRINAFKVSLPECGKAETSGDAYGM
jgi:hypothetical protein